MISLGCDVSTRKVAVGGIREDGSIVTQALELNPDHRGARRLVAARSVAYGVLAGHAGEVCVVVVEVPITRGRANTQALLGIAYVVLEAAQAACPGAVVMDVPVPTWRKEVLGRGDATKDDALREMRVRYGYDGGDDDLAEALCLADYAWSRWNRAVAA